MTAQSIHDFSVLIPHANSPSSLRRLLTSLEKQHCEKTFEVLVISNPPGRDDRIDFDDFSFSVRWLESARGANAARQKGVEAAQAPLLIFLDDDCWLENPRFLQRHWELHQENPDVMGFGGFYELHPPKTLWGEIYNGNQSRWLQEHRLPMNLCVHLLGGNSSYKKSVFDQLGFDTGLIFGGTETEFQVRLYQRKIPLRLSSDLAVAHDGCLPLSSLLKKAFKQGMGSAYISSLHQRPPRFLFQTEDADPESWKTRLGQWLYRLSFEAGENHFKRTRRKSVGSVRLWWDFSKQLLRPASYKRTPAWRQTRSLYRSVIAGLLSSKHTSAKDSPQGSSPERNRSADTPRRTTSEDKTTE